MHIDNLSLENRYIIMIALLIILLCYFVMSIILYIKRKKIFKKYNDSFGYISSFIFAAYALSPITVGGCLWLNYFFNSDISEILSMDMNPITIIVIALALLSIYMLPAIFIYLMVRSGCKGLSKKGLILSMIGIGISSPMFIVYYLITHPSGNKKAKGYSVTTYYETFQGGIESHTDYYE